MNNDVQLRNSPEISSEIPTRASYPRQLIVYHESEGLWSSIADDSILGIAYLAVSYCQADFLDNEPVESAFDSKADFQAAIEQRRIQEKHVETTIRNVCEKREIKAYWLDFVCIGTTRTEKNEDLYRIADVFRWAQVTLILIKGSVDSARSDGWISWGNRVWTYPEALLSKTLICKVGDRWVRDTNLRQVANYAYASMDEEALISLYGTDGKDFIAIPDRLEKLCLAIWSRSCSHSIYAAVRVYVLMGFLQYRISPILTETEQEAFDRLFDKNGLVCDIYPWNATNKSAEIKLSIRVKKTESFTLPNHIPAAKFNDRANKNKDSCLEGTREATLKAIYDWLGLSDNNTTEDSISDKLNRCIFWLNGLAGSGKSTIAQTVAKICYEMKILGGSFFCSRDTAELSDVHNIFTTIACQLCQLDKDFKFILSENFGEDKDLQRARAEVQLLKLIVEPLENSKQFPRCVVIIDALDECRDGEPGSVILAALNEYASRLKPIKFLITSRPDQNIIGEFRILALSGNTQNEDLNKISAEQTNKDISLFLKKRLAKIADCFDIPLPWPSEDNILTLVDRAGGLFIFASTAAKFIEDEAACDPEDQLTRLLDSVAPVSDRSPYKHLDKLYLQVFQTAFSRIEASLQSKLRTVLGTLVLSKIPLSVAALELLMQLRNGTVKRTLIRLHSLFVVPDNDRDAIRLIHPSIHDFLVDRTRCFDDRFIVDPKSQESLIARCCLDSLINFMSEALEAQEYLKTPSLQRCTAIQIFLKESADLALRYSFKHWMDHIEDSKLDDLTLSALEKIISDQNKLRLLTISQRGNAEALFKIVESSLKEHTGLSSSQFMLLYQSAVFLLGEVWFQDPSKFKGSIGRKLFKAKTDFFQNYLISDGLYGLDEDSTLSEIVILHLQNFMPKSSVPVVDPYILHVRRAAKSVHDLILQQPIPKDETIHIQVSMILSAFYRKAGMVAEEFNYLGEESSDYAEKAIMCLSTWIRLNAGVEELLTFLFQNRSFALDHFYIGKFSEVFSREESILVKILQSFFTVIFCDSITCSVEDFDGLMSLLLLPQGRLRTAFNEIPLLVSVQNSDDVPIHLTQPSLIHYFFSDEQHCSDTRFVVKSSQQHTKIAQSCLERLTQFMRTTDACSYAKSPSKSKRFTLRYYLHKGRDRALRYAYNFWQFHLKRPECELNESIQRLLKELLSNRPLIYLLGIYHGGLVSTFFSLFDMLLKKESPPYDVLTTLYEAGLSLSTIKWPTEEDFPELEKAREALHTKFFFTANFSLLSVALLKYADFIPYEDVPNLENDICELRKHANEVNEMLVAPNIHRNEEINAVLRNCMTNLYRRLLSTHWQYQVSKWEPLSEYSKALGTALPEWCKSLVDFKVKVMGMLEQQSDSMSDDRGANVSLNEEPISQEMSKMTKINHPLKRDHSLSGLPSDSKKRRIEADLEGSREAESSNTDDLILNET